MVVMDWYVNTRFMKKVVTREGTPETYSLRKVYLVGTVEPQGGLSLTLALLERKSIQV